MKDRKKRKQREEIRRILAAVRQELAEQRLAPTEARQTVSLGEIITRARQSTRL
jgi:hypothetical protein